MIKNKQISNIWNSGSTYAGRYENLFEYDANGNILSQLRRDLAGNTIDSLTYQYAKVGGKLHHNRLYHLNDNISSSAFDDDIDDMGTFDDTDLTAMMFDNNYVYDEIGNLIRDEQEEIDNMIWRPDGKLEQVVRSSSSGKLNLKFDYDVSGNRIAKHVIDNNDELLHSTYYVRDAQGNVMSVYKLDIDTVLSSLSYAQKERHIYGSSMLGMDTDSLEMIGASVLDTTIFSYMVGDKRYSMSNHLGNVLAVVTDKKLPIPNIDSTLVSYFKPEVFSTSDYSPFGVVLDGRNFNSEKFRYGMGTHEKDGEVQKDWYEFGGYGYDPRRVQRPTLDPLYREYPFQSPYSTFNGNPIAFSDPTGLGGVLNLFGGGYGKMTMEIVLYSDVIDNKQLKSMKEGMETMIKERISSHYLAPSNQISSGNAMTSNSATIVYDIKIKVLPFEKARNEAATNEEIKKNYFYVGDYGERGFQDGNSGILSASSSTQTQLHEVFYTLGFYTQQNDPNHDHPEENSPKSWLSSGTAKNNSYSTITQKDFSNLIPNASALSGKRTEFGVLRNRTFDKNDADEVFETLNNNVNNE